MSHLAAQRGHFSTRTLDVVRRATRQAAVGKKMPMEYVVRLHSESPRTQESATKEVILGRM